MISKDAVEAFLFEEAALADAHRYADWLALWAEDAFYWIPCNEDAEEADPELHVAIVNEDYTRIEDRVRRLQTGFAHAQSPRSRLSRTIGNIRAASREGGLIEARATFHLSEYRRNRMTTYAGHTLHWLRPQEDSFRIVRKEVHLINNDDYLPVMTFIM